MVRKDEPLKVTDLETGEETTPSKPAAKKGVFNRLAYGGKRAAPKIDEEKDVRVPDVSKAETSKTGRMAGKPASGNVAKSGPNKNAKSTAADGQQPAPAGGASVFERLTSGERLYRTTTQTGRKPAGRRAEQAVGVTQELGKENSLLKAANDGSQAPDEMLGNGSHKREETADESEEEDDPVIQISLIQPPVKIRSPRPVVKKSARLLFSQREQLSRRKSWRLRRIPLALVERTSLARGALPILPQGLAWMCLVLNGLLPGTGTIMSGLLGICLGAPRFSAQVTVEHRLLAFIINLTVGIFQAFTILFCLVGWCWSLGWGIILVKTAGYYKKWKDNSQDSGQDDVPQMNSISINNVDPRY
ncbi:uncharacterized protein LOC130703293 [Daphnia carinata]|uniref:uncharacterized protein LOC130703293 n=1 Tax=Daphnia carinata TaxID=120202 RepID=UPI00257CC02B|nr:uncharacterized protein LOC130703293 [Daphnia carinata]